MRTRIRRRKTVSPIPFLVAASLLSAAPVHLLHERTERYCADHRIAYEIAPGVIRDAGSVCADWPLAPGMFEVWP